MQVADFRASIIITSFNAREFLIEAIESVMAQTLRPHEIIVADDGSSDGSRDTIRSYEKRHPGWIKGVFQQQNVGIPKNRNTALRSVTGNYVGILDGDDTFAPQKLEQQLKALTVLPGAKVVYSNYRCVEPDGTELNLRYKNPQPQGDVLAEVAALNYGILRTMVADYAAVKAAGFMDERYPKLDGLWLTIKLASTCKFAYVHEPLVNKKEYPGSDSRRNTVFERLHDHAGIHSDMQPLLKSLGDNIVQAINIQWYNRMGALVSTIQEDELDAARQLLGRFCGNDTQTAESCLLAAIISARLGHIADADAARHRALIFQKDNAFIQYQAGCIAMLCTKYSDAMQAFEQALRRAPSFADAHFQLGNACFALGDTNKAYRHYEHALEIQPNHEGALRMRYGVNQSD